MQYIGGRSEVEYAANTNLWKRFYIATLAAVNFKYRNECGDKLCTQEY